MLCGVRLLGRVRLLPGLWRVLLRRRVLAYRVLGRRVLGCRVLGCRVLGMRLVPLWGWWLRWVGLLR